MKIRKMSVAGSFYPASSYELKEMLDNFFNNLENFKVDKIKA
jgi:AmmeMemoRadiSam system protein B